MDALGTGRLPFWGAVLLFSSALTCTASKPVTSTTGSGGAPAVNPYGTSACGTCVATQCSAVVAACGQDPECAFFLSCLDACPVGANGDADATCAAACPTPSGTAGQEAFASFQSCRGGVAAAACAACGAAPADGGGIALLHETCPPSQNTDPCGRCDDEKCCTVDDACKANPECVAIIACIPDTGTYGDVSTCMAMHPAGAMAFTQRYACREILCTNPKSCPGTKQGACEACLVVQCPDVLAEMVETPDGFNLYYICAGGTCSGITDTMKWLDCVVGCKAMYPTAVTAFDDFFLCASTRCGCFN